MKKLFVLLFVGLILSACSEKSLLNEPESKNEISFLKLPASETKLAKTVSFSGDINGAIGGRINIYHSYFTSEGKRVLIAGSLEIPAHAFEGVKKISISLDDEIAVVDFSPSPMQFNIPLKLNLIFSGINLQGVDRNHANFYYISDDGSRTELIHSQASIFNQLLGTIGVIKAELNHFSRFGWVI